LGISDGLLWTGSIRLGISDGLLWTGSIRLGISDGLLWTRQWNFGCGGNSLTSFSRTIILRIARRCMSEWVSEWMCVRVFEWICSYVNNHITTTTIVITNRPWEMQLCGGQKEAHFWAVIWST
jgi:hypothetical protein